MTLYFSLSQRIHSPIFKFTSLERTNFKHHYHTLFTDISHVNSAGLSSITALISCLQLQHRNHNKAFFCSETCMQSSFRISHQILHLSFSNCSWKTYIGSNKFYGGGHRRYHTIGSSTYFTLISQYSLLRLFGLSQPGAACASP